MSFKDRSFDDRLGSMGDQAESVFEAVYPEGYVRYGLNRPPIHVPSVPAFVRYTPDYLTAKGLVEAQGFGRDQVVKLKLDKREALAEWSQHFRVDLFLWDSTNHRYGWVRLADLASVAGVTLGMFDDVKPYYAYPAAELPVVGGWTTHPDKLSANR